MVSHTTASTATSTTILTNSSAHLDISSWTDTLRSATNLSHYAPSVKDLLLAGPRVGLKIGAFFLAIPEAIDGALGGRIGQRAITEATAMGHVDASTTAATLGEAGRAAFDMARAAEPAPGLSTRLSWESSRSFGSIFSYATSRWSLCCILMSVCLNRTQVYASARRGITLGWKTRTLLRIVPITLFAVQALWLLQSIQCQTSPDFGLMRWGNATKSSAVLFTQNGGTLHTLSSTLLLGASDLQSCRAVRMIPAKDHHLEQKSSSATKAGITGDDRKPPDLTGSLSLLWPLFQTLCLSQFVETFSCAIQGRTVAAETGMTLFEHSLAFAEAEAAVGSSFGWGTLDSASQAQTDTTALSDAAIKRSMILKRVNTPPEVLLIGFLSSMNHITSHLLAIFNLQSRLRLPSTAFWGLCFMSTIAWSVLNFSIDDLASQSLLRFPTVCIIGFIPHILVLVGIVFCGVTFSLAMVLSAINSNGGNRRIGERQSFLQRLLLAHHNMQANVPLSGIRVSMHMDFYTALLKTGFSALTMASEAVYLNESSEVNVKRWTWLEDERIDELEASGTRWLGPGFASAEETADSVGLVASRNQPPGSSAYLREMKTGKSRATGKVIRDGVGAGDRSGKWIMVFKFSAGIVLLVVQWLTTLTLAGMSRVGIRSQPGWMLQLVRRSSKGTNGNPPPSARQDPEELQFWMLSDSGELVLPSDDHVDVEIEMRKRLEAQNRSWSGETEQILDTNLYGWWLNGGWWGGDDSSGDFLPSSHDDEDTTSVISMASVSSDVDWESEDDNNEDGQRTPTQRPPRFSRESTPLLDTPLSLTDLARLLHPKTPDQRAEAQALAAHLSNDGITTRSRAKRIIEMERTKVLTSAHHRPSELHNMSAKLNPSEEAEILEYLITSRRAHNHNSGHAMGSSWSEGASGMGEGGPQCVVCQSAPRSIIVWPCRCLSLCDDCRVTLAMNNFDKCVCCRRDVRSFSRIFVP